MDILKTKKFSTASICFVIFIALLCAIEFLPGIEALGSFMPLYLPVFVAAVPLVLAFVFVSGGYYLGAAVSITGILAAVLLGFSTALYVAAAFLPLVVAASVMIIQQKRLRTSVLVSAGAALVGVVLVFAMIMQSSGMTVVEYLARATGAELSRLGDREVSFLYNVARANDLLSGAVTQQALDATPAADAILKMQDILRQDLNLSIVYYVVIYALTAGYLVYIIPRAIAKKMGRDVLLIPKLKDYGLPRRFWLVGVGFVAAALIGDNYGLRGFDVLMITVYNVFMFMFMVQGFCVLLFFFDERKTSKGLRAVLIVTAVLFLRTAAMPIVGLFENMLNLRKRIKIGKEQARL